MFDTLPASDAHLPVRRRWITTSVAAHVLVVAGAIVLTRGALQATRTPAAEPPLPLYVPPPAPAQVAPGHTLVPAPSPETSPTIPPLREIPSIIPPTDLGQRPFDPRDFAAIGSEDQPTSKPGSTGMEGGIYQANTVLPGFNPAVLLSQPEPTYPRVLQSAGVAGSVVVEFVIDTTGRVERGSLRIVESNHGAFAASAREAVLGARFQPARLNGKPLRQIARQRIRFVRHRD